VRTAIVESRYTTESFLTGSIPDLKTHGCIGGGIEDAFGHEGCADGGYRGGGIKGISDISLNERCLADSYNRTIGKGLLFVCGKQSCIEGG